MKSRSPIYCGIAMAAITLALVAKTSGQDLGTGVELPLGTTYKEFRLESVPPADPAGGNPVDSQVPTTAVPEPSLLGLLLAGGAGALGLSFRRRRKI